MPNETHLSEFYSSVPSMATPLNKYLFELYRIRRSAWGLALLINNADISLAQAYKVERSNLVTTWMNNQIHEQILVITTKTKNEEIVKQVKLNIFAHTGFDQWCRSFSKPRPHVVFDAMKLAAQKVGVKIMAGKVAGSPGCILTTSEAPDGVQYVVKNPQYNHMGPQNPYATMAGFKPVEGTNIWVVDNGR